MGPSTHGRRSRIKMAMGMGLRTHISRLLTRESRTALAVLAVMSVSKQPFASQQTGSDRGAQPRSWVVARTIQFFDYKVSLSPGWTAKSKGAILTITPDASGFSFDMERISTHGTTPVAFLASDDGKFLAHLFQRAPIQGKSRATGIPFIFFRASSKPDAQARVKLLYVTVLFFPHSVLLATTHALTKITRLIEQLGSESGLIIQRTVEMNGPRKTKFRGESKYGIFAMGRSRDVFPDLHRAPCCCCDTRRSRNYHGTLPHRLSDRDGRFYRGESSQPGPFLSDCWTSGHRLDNILRMVDGTRLDDRKSVDCA